MADDLEDLLQYRLGKCQTFSFVMLRNCFRILILLSLPFSNALVPNFPPKLLLLPILSHFPETWLTPTGQFVYSTDNFSFKNISHACEANSQRFCPDPISKFLQVIQHLWLCVS